MSIVIGVGIVTTAGIIYAGKKGWHAFHKAVGITPGVLVYQDPNESLALSDIQWRQLQLNQQHLTSLTDRQLRHLQYIDSRVGIYSSYQQSLQQQNITAALTEQQFVLHKLLHIRLPEMLASHYYLIEQHLVTKHATKHITQQDATFNESDKVEEANQLLQSVLDNIERRLESLLEQIQTHHLQDMRVMKNYMDSHS